MNSRGNNKPRKPRQEGRSWGKNRNTRDTSLKYRDFSPRSESTYSKRNKPNQKESKYDRSSRTSFEQSDSYASSTRLNKNNSDHRNKTIMRSEVNPSRQKFSKIDSESASFSDRKRNQSSGSENNYSLYGKSLPNDIFWGKHATRALLESGRPLHRIWCTSDLRSSHKFLQLLKDAKLSGVLVEEVSWARLGQITSGAIHQGIVIQVAAAETIDLDSLIKACKELKESPLLLALDGLTDPQNLGAIVRSSEAFGAHGLVIPQRRSAGLTGSVAKVAAGALEHLPVARVVNLNRSLEKLKDQGFRVIGLAEEGDLTISEVDLNGPLVIVIGSEGKGISLLTRKHCDQLVRIPLRGLTQSLNASVATGIALYEVAKNTWMKDISGHSPSPRRIMAKLNNSPKENEVYKANNQDGNTDLKQNHHIDISEKAHSINKNHLENFIDLDQNPISDYLDGSINL